MKQAHIPRVFDLLAQTVARYAAATAESVYRRYHTPFHVLVATILSSRTRDETTLDASERLFARVNSPQDLERLDIHTLESLIYPVGFYKTKARLLHKLPAVLHTQYNGRIPDTVEDLVRLPGVGRKTANLVVSVAFDKPAICVDIHVHRICNRWGYVHTGTPLQTEMHLRCVLPVRFWKPTNRLLVPFGKHLCLPRTPRCSQCPLTPYCAHPASQHGV
jgi:endonuclease III